MDFNAIMGGAQTGAAAGTGSIKKTGGSSPSDLESLFAQLLKEASKTPEERAREHVLEKNKLSEDDYNRLPKAEREGIDRQIAEAVRHVAEQRRASMTQRNGVAA